MKIYVEGETVTEGFQLDVVLLRLMKDAPLLSRQRITSPDDAVNVVGEFLCSMDRKVVCTVNLKAVNTFVKHNFASIGVLNYSIVNSREIFNTSILSSSSQTGPDLIGL